MMDIIITKIEEMEKRAKFSSFLLSKYSFIHRLDYGKSDLKSL